MGKVCVVDEVQEGKRGVCASLQAYRKWVDESRGGVEEPRLPGVGLNNNQLFFLSYAHVRTHTARLLLSGRSFGCGNTSKRLLVGSSLLTVRIYCSSSSCLAGNEESFWVFYCSLEPFEVVTLAFE